MEINDCKIYRFSQILFILRQTLKIEMATSPRKSSRKPLFKKEAATQNRIGVTRHSNKEKNFPNQKQKDAKSPNSKKKEKEELNAPSENCEDDIDEPPREMTKEEIARENLTLLKAEETMKELKTKIEEKEIIFNKLLLELKRMTYIFNKVKEIDIGMAAKEKSYESKSVSTKTSYKTVSNA